MEKQTGIRNVHVSFSHKNEHLSLLYFDIFSDFRDTKLSQLFILVRFCVHKIVRLSPMLVLLR